MSVVPLNEGAPKDWTPAGRPLGTCGALPGCLVSVLLPLAPVETLPVFVVTPPMVEAIWDEDCVLVAVD